MNLFLAGFSHLEPLCSRSGVNSERPPRKLHRGASEAIMAFVGAGSLDGLRLHFAVVSSPHSQEYCSRYHRLGLSQRRTAQTHCKFWRIFFTIDFWSQFYIVILKVAFFQKVLIHLSFPQTYEPFIFLSVKIWIMVTEICLEIEDVFKFDSLGACKGKKAKVAG